MPLRVYGIYAFLSSFSELLIVFASVDALFSLLDFVHWTC